MGGGGGGDGGGEEGRRETLQGGLGVSKYWCWCWCAVADATPRLIMAFPIGCSPTCLHLLTHARRRLHGQSSHGLTGLDSTGLDSTIRGFSSHPDQAVDNPSQCLTQCFFVQTACGPARVVSTTLSAPSALCSTLPYILPPTRYVRQQASHWSSTAHAMQRRPGRIGQRTKSLKYTTLRSSTLPLHR